MALGDASDMVLDERAKSSPHLPLLLHGRVGYTDLELAAGVHQLNIGKWRDLDFSDTLWAGDVEGDGVSVEVAIVKVEGEGDLSRDIYRRGADVRGHASRGREATPQNNRCGATRAQHLH